jgi:hypothetical protein
VQPVGTQPSGPTAATGHRLPPYGGVGGPTPPAPATRPDGLARGLGRPLRWVAPVLAITPLFAAAWFVTRFNPTDRVADPTGPCLYHAATGLNGPGCGGTRMFYYLIHGDLVQAARHHLPALIAVPFLGYLWLRWTTSRFGVNLAPLRLPRWTLIAYGVFFLVFTMALRNIDWGPFGWFDIPYLDSSTYGLAGTP